jgi:preprotein translocase subunit SecG
LENDIHTFTGLPFCLPVSTGKTTSTSPQEQQKQQQQQPSSKRPIQQGQEQEEQEEQVRKTSFVLSCLSRSLIVVGVTFVLVVLALAYTYRGTRNGSVRRRTTRTRMKWRRTRRTRRRGRTRRTRRRRRR